MTKIAKRSDMDILKRSLQQETEHRQRAELQAADLSKRLQAAEDKYDRLHDQQSTLLAEYRTLEYYKTTAASLRKDIDLLRDDYKKWPARLDLVLCLMSELRAQPVAKSTELWEKEC